MILVVVKRSRHELHDCLRRNQRVSAVRRKSRWRRKRARQSSYNYTNRSKADIRDRSPIHDGAAHLRVVSCQTYVGRRILDRSMHHGQD